MVVKHASFVSVSASNTRYPEREVSFENNKHPKNRQCWRLCSFSSNVIFQWSQWHHTMPVAHFKRVYESQWNRTVYRKALLNLYISSTRKFVDSICSYTAHVPASNTNSFLKSKTVPRRKEEFLLRVTSTWRVTSCDNQDVRSPRLTRLARTENSYSNPKVARILYFS